MPSTSGTIRCSSHSRLTAEPIDDIDSAKYMTPALTTISQSKYAIGAQSAIQVINARDGAEPWRKVLKPTLVVRRST